MMKPNLSLKKKLIKKILKHLILGLGVNLSFIPLYAGERADKPVQLQYVFPNGIHTGYHFNDSIFVGLTTFLSFEGSLDGSDSEKTFGQKKSDKTEFQNDPSHHLETRISPWDKLGWYFSLGAIHFGQTKATQTFKKTNRTINQTDYENLGIKIVMEQDPQTVAMGGAGYQAIWDNGFSLTFGVHVHAAKSDSKVSITYDGAKVSQKDQDAFKKRVKDDLKAVSFPVGWNLGLGYNF